MIYGNNEAFNFDTEMSINRPCIVYFTMKIQI